MLLASSVFLTSVFISSETTNRRDERASYAATSARWFTTEFLPVARMSERLVYLIHAAEDKPLAGFLKSQLETIPDVRVFAASKAGQIPTGEEWLNEIHRHLRAASAFVILLTPRSVDRHWVWYESGAAWMSGKKRCPVVAGGLNPSEVKEPIGGGQILLLEEADGAEVLFRDLGGQLEDVPSFCETVRVLARGSSGAKIDEERTRLVHQAFGGLGEPPKALLRRMLAAGGLTVNEMGEFLASLPQRYVSDLSSVEKMAKALDAGGLVQRDFEGRWRIKPELEPSVRRCFDAPLSMKLQELAKEICDWAGGPPDHPIDQSVFRERFAARIEALRQKAVNDHGETDEWLVKTPSSAMGAKGIADGLLRVAGRVP